MSELKNINLVLDTELQVVKFLTPGITLGEMYDAIEYLIPESRWHDWHLTDAMIYDNWKGPIEVQYEGLPYQYIHIREWPWIKIDEGFPFLQFELVKGIYMITLKQI